MIDNPRDAVLGTLTREQREAVLSWLEDLEYSGTRPAYLWEHEWLPEE